MAVRGYEEEAMIPKSRAVEPNVEYCKPISNVATPSFKHGDCSSEEECLAVNQEVEISKFSFHPKKNIYYSLIFLYP